MEIDGKYYFIGTPILPTNFRNFMILKMKRRPHLFSTMFDFMSEDDYKAWAKIIEDVRVAICHCALMATTRENNDESYRYWRGVFFETLKRALNYFNSYPQQFVLKVSEADYDALVVMVGKGVSRRDYVNISDYLYQGQHIFRRDLENYIARRADVPFEKIQADLQTIKRARKEKNRCKDKS